jgi:hypothetical protein
MNGLDFDTINELLKGETKSESGMTTGTEGQPISKALSQRLKELYPTRPQIGPLRYTDTENRCMSRNCRAPTHYKLFGVPKCDIHCLREMNLLLVDTEELKSQHESQSEQVEPEVPGLL